MSHSPNQPILLTSSLHVDDARKAITGLVNNLIQESTAINDPADIETVTGYLLVRETAPRSRRDLGTMFFDGAWEKPIA